MDRMFSYRVDDDLVLRLPEERDAEELLKVINEDRAYLEQWFPAIANANSISHGIEYIRGLRLGYAKNECLSAFVYWQGSLAGIVHLNPHDFQNKLSWLYYWVREGLQGKGIATRSCNTILEHGFNTLGLNRVQAQCSTENKPSANLLKRLGFTLEGTLRQATLLRDEYHDLMTFGLLAHEWQSNPARIVV